MGLWVFGYGSLLWNPGFTPLRQVKARLADYHRSFCMLSIHHRGTPEQPGLVLALDHRAGSACTGMAFEIAPADETAVLASLRERELVSSAYVEQTVTVTPLDAGPPLTALTYVIDPAHVQYCQFDLEQQARMIARAVGGRGPNPDYLFNTAQHLAQMGLCDPELDWLVARVRALGAT